MFNETRLQREKQGKHHLGPLTLTSSGRLAYSWARKAARSTCASDALRAPSPSISSTV